MNGPLDQVASWPVRTAAVAVMSPAGLLAARGPLDRPFSWASVTKLLTTLAALDVVQRGLLDLDEPAGPPGATIRHLLAHASGLGPRGDKVLSKPGRQRIYSNRGIEIVAHATAARAGKPFGPLLAEEICRPLGLRRTHLAGSPSWGAAGPLGDLAALGSELLSPSLVDSELLAEATRTAFPGLPGVVPGFGRQPLCDWGLGFEIRDSKAPHWTGSRNSPATFGHFGRSGSFLWVDPEAGLACAALTDRDFGPWAARAWPRLSDDILTSYGSGLPVAGGQAQQVGDVHRPHLRLAAAQPLTELTQAAGIDRHHVIDPGRSDLVELGIQYPPGVGGRTSAQVPAARSTARRRAGPRTRRWRAAVPAARAIRQGRCAGGRSPAGPPGRAGSRSGPRRRTCHSGIPTARRPGPGRSRRPGGPRSGGCLPFGPQFTFRGRGGKDDAGFGEIGPPYR